MLERFIEDYAERAYQFAYRLCGNSEEAKELTQAAFFKIIQKWDKYDPSQPLENWFLRILRNVYYDSLDKSASRPSLSFDAPVAGRDSETLTYAEVLADERDEEFLTTLERRETAEQVRGLIDSLLPDHKAVLTLCDIQGMSYEEIAEVLGCSEGAVRSKIWRARAALKEKLLEKPEEVVDL